MEASKSHPKGIERIAGNSRPPFEFYVPRKILEERAKSWDSLFEKYSMEITDALELNLETLHPETDTKHEYVSEPRAPLRNPPACIQFWVDTGKPPCKAFFDENYCSDTGSSLSEFEIAVPSPAPSPPFKYTLPHLPQAANIPHEVDIKIPSLPSSSSVDTAEYILSNTNTIKNKIKSSIMERTRISKKFPGTNANTEDVYVDVCGTDELPKIAEKANQNYRDSDSQASTILNFPANLRENELEGTLNLHGMLDKIVPEESIIRVPTGSLKIGDVIPSLQRIRDGPECYNVDYSNRSPSDKSEDLIDVGINKTPSLILQPPTIAEPENETKAFHRRKLFTNRNSPIELIASKNQSLRRVSSSVILHPALEDLDMTKNKSKWTMRRKKSLFRRKLQLQDVDDEIKDNHGKENVDSQAKSDVSKGKAVKERKKNSEFSKDLRKRIVSKIPSQGKSKTEKISKVDLELQKKTEVNVTKKKKQTGKKTKIAFSKRGTSTDFINTEGVKVRDLIVSLERLPVVLVQRLTKQKPTKIEFHQPSPKEISSKAILSKNWQESVKKINIFEDSDDEETESEKEFNKLLGIQSTTAKDLPLKNEEPWFRKPCEKFNLSRRKFEIRTISHSSDEEATISMGISKKRKTQSTLTNVQSESNSPLKANNKFRNSWQSAKASLIFSSDEEESIFMEVGRKEETQNTSTNVQSESNSPLKANNKFRNSRQSAKAFLIFSSDEEESIFMEIGRKENSQNTPTNVESESNSPLEANNKFQNSRQSANATLKFSSDEEESIFMEVGRKVETQNTSTNVQSESNSPLKANHKFRNSRQSAKASLIFSSDEEESIFMEIGRKENNQDTPTNVQSKSNPLFRTNNKFQNSRQSANATLKFSSDEEESIFMEIGRKGNTQDTPTNVQSESNLPLKPNNKFQNSRQSAKVVKKSFSDEEGSIAMDISEKEKTQNRLLNVQSKSNPLFRTNNKFQSSRQSRKLILNISSDEENDFTKIIETFSEKRSKSLRDERELSNVDNYMRNNVKSLSADCDDNLNIVNADPFYIRHRPRLVLVSSDDSSDLGDKTESIIEKIKHSKRKSSKRNSKVLDSSVSEKSSTGVLEQISNLSKDSRSKLQSNSAKDTNHLRRIVNSSRLKSSPGNSKNNYFIDSIVQETKEVEKPSVRLFTLNRKRKWSSFGGSISSDSSSDESDIFHFKSRLLQKEIYQKPVRLKSSGTKLQIFKTKSFWESEEE